MPLTTTKREKNDFASHQNIKSKLMKSGAIQCPYDECLFRYAADKEIIEILI